MGAVFSIFMVSPTCSLVSHERLQVEVVVVVVRTEEGVELGAEDVVQVTVSVADVLVETVEFGLDLPPHFFEVNVPSDFSVDSTPPAGFLGKVVKQIE